MEQALVQQKKAREALKFEDFAAAEEDLAKEEEKKRLREQKAKEYVPKIPLILNA